MKVRFFRILAVFFSIILFSAGITSALSIFMSLTGYNEPANTLFILGFSLFSTYYFSAFLIPLLFLYAAVLLLIPGWSRESAFILGGFPAYFMTAIIGERIIYRLLLMSNIPLIKQFVTVSALICILLLICLEVFVMIVLAGKRSLILSAQYSCDIVNDTYAEDGAAEKNSGTTDNSTDRDTSPAENQQAADNIDDAPLVTDSAETASNQLDSKKEGGRTEKSETIGVHHVAAKDNSAYEADKLSENKVNGDPLVVSPNAAEVDLGVEIQKADDLSESTESRLLTVEDAIKAEAESESDEYHLDFSKIRQAQDDVSGVAAGEEEKGFMLDTGSQKNMPAEPASASFGIQRPVSPFDPSDPNNLFQSLDEITADVKRITAGYNQPEKSMPLNAPQTIAQTGTDSASIEAAALVPSKEPCELTAVSQPLPTKTAEPVQASENILVAVPQGKAVADRSSSQATVETIQQPAEQVASTVPLPPDAAFPPTPETAVSSIQSIPRPVTEVHALPVEDRPLAAVSKQKPPLEYMPVPNKVSDLIDSLVILEPKQSATVNLAAKDPSVEVETVVPQASHTVAATGGKDLSAFSEKEDMYDDDEYEENDEDDKTVDELFLDKEPAVEEPLKPVLKPARKKYAIPFELLTDYPDGEYWIVDDATRRAAMMLKSTFSEFKIEVSITGIRKGPVVTMFEMLPSPGIKLSKITNLQDNIALRLAASNVRIVAPIPGKHAVGIEVPNKKRSIVSFRELIEADLPESDKMAIPVVLGKDVTGNPQMLDLAQTPHLLIAGATGSGKSVCVNSIILSILYNRHPNEVKLILVDPKIVELKLYNDIAHLLSPVITDPKRAFQALQYCLCEMERRYALLDNMGVRDIKTFNSRIKADKIAMEPLPYIVIIIDEFADLMATSGKELEATVSRLCAMSRAIGIHLVLATQRPSIDVITGLIKANIPSRIAFMVASKTDSRIILDEGGAEKLLGKGDMLFISAAQPFPTRMQGAFVSEQEVERVVSCVKDYCEPEYIDDEIFVDDDDDTYDSALYSENNDPLYDQALEIVTFAGKASASYVQRKLKIGYNRAARLIEEMEARGIVGPPNGSKPREVLRH